MKKLIVITGGSQGIGASTAILAAKKGYHVCINYHQNDALANEVAGKIKAGGGEATAIKADISREDEVVNMFSFIDTNVGKISSLVNNAGILISQKRFVDMEAERIQKIFATNVTGSFLCAREAVKRMSVNYGGAGGSIVNVSSIAARSGSPFEYVDYAASKGAIDTMTIGLAKEVAAEKIRVNAVRPGIIQTDIHARSGDPGRIRRLQSGIPLQRAGLPEEIAHTILWLISDEAAYVTGAIFDVTGGK